MNIRSFSLFLLFYLASTQIGITQQITTNENGEKIVVYPDGSWEYADEEDIKESHGKGNP